MKSLLATNLKQYSFALSKDIDFPHISTAILGGDARKLIARVIFPLLRLHLEVVYKGSSDILATVKISEPRNWQTMSPTLMSLGAKKTSPFSSNARTQFLFGDAF
jgi:hypothetical protein